MATTMSAPVAVKASALIASARISFAFFASLMWPVVQQLIVDDVASPRMPPTVPMRKIEKTIVAADVQNTASFACFTRCVGCGGPRDTDVSIGARPEFACAWPIARPMTGVPVSIDARTGTIRTRALFDNLDGSLIPGTFASLEVGTLGENDVIMISPEAISTDQ